MRDPAESDMLGYPCVAKCVGGGNEGWSKGGREKGWVPSSDQQPVKRRELRIARKLGANQERGGAIAECPLDFL